MKKISYSITTGLTITGILLAQSVMPTFAATTLGGQKVINEVNHLQTREQNQASHSASRSATQLQNIITRANTLITNRLTSLNDLVTRLQSDTRLSAGERSSLTTDVQTDINGLNALKTKIDADTDVTTARTDAKTIITNYYVFAIFEPKIRLLITLNNLQMVSADLQALVPQLQNLINTFKSQGKDVSQLQPLLDDISSQLTTINTTLGTDIVSVEAVSTTTKGASSTFQKIRQDISQIVRTDFAKIRSDFSKMRPLFRQLVETTTETPTPSGTAPSGTEPTATTTPVTPSTSPSPTQ